MANLIRRRTSPYVGLWRDVDEFYDERFDGFFSTRPARGEFIPSLELTERDKEYVMTAELPGMTESDVNVEVDDDNVLTLSGQKKVDPRAPRSSGAQQARRPSTIVTASAIAAAR